MFLKLMTDYGSHGRDPATSHSMFIHACTRAILFHRSRNEEGLLVALPDPLVTGRLLIKIISLNETSIEYIRKSIYSNRTVIISFVQ